MKDMIRAILKDSPDLLRRYEKNEARYILQLPDDYETIDIDLDFAPDELAQFIIALAENDLTFDEWAVFKIKELIISEKMSALKDHCASN